MNKTTTPILPALPEIPGVEQLEIPESGSRILAGPFYADQVDMLVEMAKAARDRAGQGRVFIAREGEGFTIFRRTQKS